MNDREREKTLKALEELVKVEQMAIAAYEQAIEAYNAVMKNYPKSTFIADAYVKVGLSYKTLKQPDKAREAFEYVVKTYPDTVASTIAQQNLVPQRP